MFTCPLCGQHPPIRSNQAIVEEANRLTRHLRDQSEPSCPVPTCANHGVALSAKPGAYAKYGLTAGGSIRWRCTACKKVFTQGAKPLKRQQITHRNKDLFQLLVNKVPMRRICAITELSPRVVYDKLEWIHEQCMLFVGERERRMFTDSVPLPKMYVAVDRQQYIVNWSRRRDKRNVMLAAIASADLGTGYVFGFHLNFDKDVDPLAVEADAKAIGDEAKGPPFRRYARLWLPSDYERAVAESKLNDRERAKAKKAGKFTPSPVEPEIEGRYDENQLRYDIEVNEDGANEVKLPDHGMQVHEQYTIYGHFLMLRQLLERAPKVRVFLDQDPGFRAAFMSVFTDRILLRSADAFYVSVLKEATVDAKAKLLAKAKAAWTTACAEFPPGTDKWVIELEMMKRAMREAVPKGPWGDVWVEHPFPNKAEPAKKVCWLTNMGDYDEDRQANLYLKASLHAVDRFFMQTRRMLSLAERPIASASAARRMWHGYSPYSPAHLQRSLDIYRVYYNYCVVGADKKTPAMRLGLARGPVTIDKILAFDPMRKYRANGASVIIN